MSQGPETRHLTLLERLDLAIAARMLGEIDVDDEVDVDGILSGLARTKVETAEIDSDWIAEVLRLRGYAVMRRDVDDILLHRPGRFAPDHQEFLLIVGMHAMLRRITALAARGDLPSGELATELFRVLTERISRFRNNTVRRDMPWDGILYVPYPEPEDVPDMVADFTIANCYGDDPEVFPTLHPVRQSVRILWRFARVAPFPDLNIVMAFALMNLHLLAHGYPRIVPTRGDRELLARLIGGSAPPRVVQFESRLVERVR